MRVSVGERHQEPCRPKPNPRPRPRPRPSPSPDQGSVIRSRAVSTLIGSSACLLRTRVASLLAYEPTSVPVIFKYR